MTSLVKVVWGGLGDGNVTWEFEEPDEGFVSEFIHLSNFLGRKFFKWGKVITSHFSRNYLYLLIIILFVHLIIICVIIEMF